MSQSVYLKLNKVTETSSKEIRLGDAAQLLCQDEGIMNRLKTLKIFRVSSDERRRYVMDAIQVIQLIQKEFPAVQVENLGEVSFVIAYKPPGLVSPLWEWTKTVFVCLVCFCGAAFAIMTFNNDVDVTDVFQELYLLVMGRESNGFTILEAGYSLGLAIGILVFFNHFASVKLNTDPTPLEVEMSLYEDNITKTLIARQEGEEQNQAK